MTLEELRKEADEWFEWPSECKNYVTLTSAILFAHLMVQKAKKAQKGEGMNEEIKQWIKDNLAITAEYQEGGVNINLWFAGENKEFSSAFICLPE